MSRYDRLLLTGIFVLAVIALVRAERQAERPPSPWKVERCYTNDCIATLLNRLPAARAAEAKITTWRDASFVWYRE